MRRTRGEELQPMLRLIDERGEQFIAGHGLSVDIEHDSHPAPLFL